MKTRIFLMIVIGLTVVSAILGYMKYDDANRDFSPWMSYPELTAYMKKFDPKRPGDQDFWSSGHWITAAEGRWRDGSAQFRIRYNLAPIAKGFVWRWFIDQDQESFGKRLKEFGDDGFVLVCSNSFQRPDGTTRYQAVWHKTGPVPARP